MRLAAVILLSATCARIATAQRDSLAAVLDPEKMVSAILAPFALEAAMSDMRPVLASLKIRFGQDSELLRILDSLKLEAFATFTGPYSARAVNRESALGIEVDLSLITSTHTFATYIAARRALSGVPGSSHVVYMDLWKEAIGLGLRRRLAARQAIGDIPAFEIWEQHNESQLREHFLDDYNTRVYQEILTWVILHEVGHHRLGHLSDTTKRLSDEESREREVAADIWGFRTMQQLGYPVDGVLDFLALQDDLERAMYGVVKEQGSHPSWHARRRTLSQAIEPQGQAPPWTILHSVLESQNVQTGGYYVTKVYLMFPTEPDPYGLELGAAYSREEGHFMYVERTANQIHLYGNSGDRGIVHIAIRHLADELPEVEVEDRSTARPYAHGLAFKNPFTHLQALEVHTGLSLGQMLQESPSALINRTLSQITADPEIRERAGSVLRQEAGETRRLLGRFMRGEISAEELQARAEANSERSKSRLTTVLGPENYSRWAATFLGQRTVELGVSNLLRMQRQPRGSGELFARLRGHRSDLRAPTKPSHPVRLRTTGRELRSKDYEPVIQKYGLFNRKMFNKDPDPGLLNQYQLTEVNGEFVVADGASGLTWQRSGSPYPMGASPIKAWVRDVNSRGYAGHRDWRLPTGEEVMTLSEPEYYRNQLHIQPLFDDTQTCIWTADTMGEYLEALDVTMGFLHAQATDEACYLRLVRPT